MKRIAARSGGTGSFFAFHGSKPENWHGILHMGLRNMSGEHCSISRHHREGWYFFYSVCRRWLSFEEMAEQLLRRMSSVSFVPLLLCVPTDPLHLSRGDASETTRRNAWTAGIRLGIAPLSLWCRCGSLVD